MPILQGTTCFEEHRKRNLCCLKDSCRLNYDYPEDLNCVLISADKISDRDNEEIAKGNGDLVTFEELGDRLGFTRAYVFQVCKRARIKMLRYFSRNNLLDDLTE